jgi:hypothetical protein
MDGVMCGIICMVSMHGIVDGVVSYVGSHGSCHVFVSNQWYHMYGIMDGVVYMYGIIGMVLWTVSCVVSYVCMVAYVGRYGMCHMYVWYRGLI